MSIENSYRFFENGDCKYFPCHKELGDFNGLFCYCPLYFKGELSGESFIFRKGWEKDKFVRGCTFPHQPENYDIYRWRLIIAICTEHGRLATYSFSCECASSGGLYTELIATMEDNATTQAIIEQMPMTLPMMDLYGREMCYRYGAYALPTDNLQSDGYEVGDIAYWAPGGSLVILYRQNGEHFERQHLGNIDSGVDIFENTGDVDVTFEVITD